MLAGEKSLLVARRFASRAPAQRIGRDAFQLVDSQTAVGTPILANARSTVLVEHCVKSNGGLYYANGDEFVECLSLLVRDGKLRAAMGRNGRDYVRRSYRWDVVLGKYERIFARLRSAR